MLHFILETLKSTNRQRLEINYKSFVTCRASQILELVTFDLDDKLQGNKKVFSPSTSSLPFATEHMQGFIKMSISGNYLSIHQSKKKVTVLLDPTVC